MKKKLKEKQAVLELKLVRIRDLTAEEMGEAIGAGCSLRSAQLCKISN